MKTNFKTMSALQGFVSAVSIILVIIGLAVLAGWVFNIQFLRSVLPRAANMQFNTALGILSAGTSLWFLRDEEERSRQKLIGQALALLIILLGSLSLSQYLFGWNLGIDELFIEDSATAPSPFPGRMSPISAVCFTLSGLSLLWIGTKPSQYLALSVLILSLLAVIGYLFDYGALYRLPGYISMALHSGVSFLILSLGILAARPSLGFMKLLISGVAAGRTALFLLPTTILLIILLGYTVELGGRLRIFASGNESAIVVVLLILVYTPLIYFYLNRIHQAEMEIVRLSRLYATLSQVGQTVVRVRSQQELFESICKVAVEFGQFRLAWIGLFNSETGQVTPVAEHGYGETRLPFAKIDANETSFDRGLTALAIRSDSPQFSHNIQADPRMAHWHESSALGGYHSAAALPIRQKGQMIGLLSLYAADIGFFAAKEERNLLEELASNISFALDALQVEAERERAEERFRLVVESMPNSIVMVDGDGKIRLVNGQTERLFGYSRAELTGQRVDILVPDRYREGHANHRALFLGHPSARPMGMGRDLFGLRKDGSEFPVEIGLNPIETEQGSMVVASIVDITERKRAEEARRESEEHYQLLFNEIRYGFALHEIICDGSGKPVDYRFLEINPAFEKLTGLRASELVGRTVLEALPNTEPYWIETYGRVAITGESIEFSSYAQEFDRYYEVSAYRSRPGQFAVIFMDETERQRTRIKLEESENRYRSLFENMPTGYAHCQMLFENRQPHDFIYLSANPAFETLTGLKDVTGRRVSEVIPGIREANPELFEIYGRVALSGKPEWFETRIDSLGIWLSISAYCPKEGDFAAVFENITERKRAEQTLKESEEQYRALIEQAGDGIFISDSTGRYIEVNSAGMAMLGYSREELLQKNLSDLIPAEDKGKNPPRLDELRAGKSIIAERRLIRKDGSLLPVEISGKMLSDGRLQGIVRDITERKRTMEQLRLSEERFSNAFRASPAGITITRIADGKFVDANDSFCRMFEFSRDEVVGHTSTELNMWTPEERKKLIDEQIRSGGLQNFELRARAKSGRIINILFSSKPTELEGETHHVTTMIDITERKRAEQELQQSNARFTRMVDSNMVGIAIADASGRIMLANDYFLHLLNVTRQDFLEGKVDWRKFTPPEWLSADEEALHELSEHGVCEPYEKEYVRADGSRVAVYIADALLPGPDEQIIALVLDITERKRAEEKLARQNQRLKVLREIDTAILAADSIETIVAAALTHIRELIECRRAVVSVFDWEKNEALMFDVQMDRETSFPRGTQLPLAPFQGIIQTLSKNQPVLVNDTHTLADPSPLMRRFIKEGIRSQYVLPFFSNGKLVGTFSMSADTPGFFDEEKMNLGQEVANQIAIAFTQSSLLDALRELNVKLEQRVRERTADLEAANKELEAFSYSVSHDLRAPIRHISGFIELLNRRAPDLDVKNRHYLATIAQSAQQMGTLIDELLAFSRLGRAEMKKTKLDLEALVRQIIPELQLDTSDRDIVWKIDSLPQVYGDHVLLKSVLTNLISNALKFTKTRPQAVIEIGTVSSTKGEVICYVRDNGVGFDMQYAEKLFGLFQRIHRADEFEGTGVGLANVRRIIHRHGGRTWAEGELDRGATFYFSLPTQSGGQP